MRVGCQQDHCGYRRYSLNQGKHQQCTGGKWGGGLLSLVNTCGEIGVCPPCTEAHPLQRVGPLWVVGGGPPAKGGRGWPSVSGG